MAYVQKQIKAYPCRILLNGKKAAKNALTPNGIENEDLFFRSFCQKSSTN